MEQLHWEIRAEGDESGVVVVMVKIKARQWHEAVYVVDSESCGDWLVVAVVVLDGVLGMTV